MPPIPIPPTPRAQRTRLMAGDKLRQIGDDRDREQFGRTIIHIREVGWLSIARLRSAQEAIEASKWLLRAVHLRFELTPRKQQSAKASDAIE